MNSADIGGRLRRVREDLALTQQDVASYLGVTREAISNYETGQRAIGLDALQRISNLYGCSAADFLSEPVQATTPDVAFRTGGLGADDLEAVAWAKRFLRNVVSLRTMLKE